MSADRFVGVWRLVYCEYVSPDGQTLYPFGPEPRGTLTFDAAGRIEVTLDDAIVGLIQRAAQLIAAGVVPPLVPQPAMTGRDGTFTGHYVVAESHFLHRIEASPVPAWNGTTARRAYAFRRNRLVISVTDAPLPGVASFIWERTEASD
jgi:hypothetical protein